MVTSYEVKMNLSKLQNLISDMKYLEHSIKNKLETASKHRQAIYSVKKLKQIPVAD